MIAISLAAYAATAKYGCALSRFAAKCLRNPSRPFPPHSSKPFRSPLTRHDLNGFFIVIFPSDTI